MNSGHIVACAFAFGVAVACGGEVAGGEASVREQCEKGCAIEARIECPNDDPATCVSDCELAALDIPAVCRAQTDAALECAVNRPASDWTCDERGNGGTREGVCFREGSAELTCIRENSEGRCPDVFANDGECDDPTGTDLCPAGTDLVDCR